MSKDYNPHFIKKILDVIQEMKELSGPDTTADYVLVMTAVKMNIEQRIATAAANMPKKEEQG